MWQSSYNLFTDNIISFNLDMGVYIDKQWGSGIDNIFYNNTLSLTILFSIVSMFSSIILRIR